MIKEIIRKVRIKPLGLFSSKPVYQPNRRNAPRAKSRNLMKCLRTDDVPAEFVANLCDLSETGMQFFCGYPIEPKSVLKVMLNLPEKNKVISVLGKAMWLRRVRGHEGVFRIGVLFLTMDSEDRALLRSFVKGTA